MSVDVRGPRNAVVKDPRPDDRFDPGLASVRGWMARPRYGAKGQSHVHQTYRYAVGRSERGSAAGGSLSRHSQQPEGQFGAEGRLEVAGGEPCQGDQSEAGHAGLAAK